MRTAKFAPTQPTFSLCLWCKEKVNVILSITLDKITDKLSAISEIMVGDVVQFKGGAHYASSNATADAGKPKAGPATVIMIAKGAKHPYHLVHTDKQSAAYGWVDADKLSMIAEIKIGDVVRFKGGPHYASSNAAADAGNTKAGSATVTMIAKGAKHPYHLVHADKQSTVYGWVDAEKVET